MSKQLVYLLPLSVQRPAGPTNSQNVYRIAARRNVLGQKNKNNETLRILRKIPLNIQSPEKAANRPIFRKGFPHVALLHYKNFEVLILIEKPWQSHHFFLIYNRRICGPHELFEFSPRAC